MWKNTFLVAALVALHVNISSSGQRAGTITTRPDQVRATTGSSDVIMSNNSEDSAITRSRELEHHLDDELTEFVEFAGESVGGRSLPIRKQNNTRRIVKNRKTTSKSKIIKSLPKSAFKGITSPRNLPQKLNVTSTKKATNPAVTKSLVSKLTTTIKNTAKPPGTNTKVSMKKKKKLSTRSTISIKKPKKVKNTTNVTRSNRFWNRNRPPIRSNSTYILKHKYLKKNGTKTQRTTKAYHLLKTNNSSHGWKQAAKLNKTKTVAGMKILTAVVANLTSTSKPARSVTKKTKMVNKKSQNNRPRIAKEKKKIPTGNSTCSCRVEIYSKGP